MGVNGRGKAIKVGCIVRSVLFEAPGGPQRAVAVKVKAAGRWNPRGDRACNIERNEEASWCRIKRGPVVLVCPRYCAALVVFRIQGLETMQRR